MTVPIIPDGSNGEPFHHIVIPSEHHLTEEPAYERSDDPRQDGGNPAHRVLAWRARPRDEPRDESDDDH